MILESNRIAKKKEDRAMNLNRRSLIASAAGAAGLAICPASAKAAVEVKKRVKFGLASYSYWHFRPPKLSIHGVIDKAASFGVEGVDILHRQLDSEDPAYLRSIKRHAFLNGVAPICLSIHQDFVEVEEEARNKNIEHTKHCLELAYELGAPSIRLNSGRWNTIESFDDLMAKRGEEPAIEGKTEDDAFNWCIDCIAKCLPKAQECGVVMALENHWGLTRSPEGLLRIAEVIDSPWLGILMDTGNFLEEPYDKLERIASKTVFVQAKTYFGGGEWYTLDLDYPRIADILKKANYNGYVSLEFEGKAAPDDGVRQSMELLQKAFNG